jgi:Uma2 family endonuclease
MMKTVPVLASDEIQEDKPMPSRNHARAAHNLGVQLERFKDRFVICDQLSLNLNGWQTIPDLCVFPRGELATDWLSDDDEVKQPPLLVVEILSPKQNLQPLVDKIREFVRHGVKSCWLVEPATRVISVFPASGGSRAFTEGILRDESIGIEVPLAEVFA